MNERYPRHLRLLSIVVVNLALLAVIAACSCGGSSTGAGPTPTPSIKISICAVDPLQEADFPAAACGSGTYAAVSSDADIEITAVNPSGHPLSHEPLTIHRSGANSGTASITTDANGKASYLYQGSHLGTDSVTASVSGASAKAGGVVINWIRKQAMTRPIVWVHGIHEDATDFAHEIHGVPDPDQSTDGSEQTWTSLLGALTTTYSPSAIQPFCYVDDIAWSHSPSGCPTDESQCQTCQLESEGSIQDNAIQLATLVTDMYAEYHHSVTLMAYSMGGAIVRTLLAGCPTSVSDLGLTLCLDAAHDVDHVFLLNTAQEGSWLLTAANMSGFSEADLSFEAASPFATVLSMIQSGLYATVQSKLGLDLHGQAITDLTPQSPNVLAHNSRAPQTGADFYTFYGDIRVGIQANFLIYNLPPKTLLPVGDLVFLPQSDPATATPLWGGAALCASCSSPSAGQAYSSSPTSLQFPNGQYHEWALTDQITIPMTDLKTILNGLSNSQSALQNVLNSPVQHLNISQPASQDPGSSVKVKDITGLAGASTTNMSTEIYLILVQSDGLE